jgi:uncharacterized protein YecT (DUF1311 family)
MRKGKSRLAALGLCTLTAVAPAARSAPCESQAKAPPSGESPAKKKSNDPCAYPATDEELLTCRHKDHDRAEASVHELVQALAKMQQGDAELRRVFATAQAKWSEFREAECKLETFDSRDGTAFESYWLECLTTHARERIKTLQRMKDNP